MARETHPPMEMDYIPAKAWMDAWRIAAERLAELRRREIRNCDTQQALQNLADAFESARRLNAPAATSGLVIQQQLFQRLRDRTR